MTFEMRLMQRKIKNSSTIHFLYKKSNKIYFKIKRVIQGLLDQLKQLYYRNFAAFDRYNIQLPDKALQTVY